MIALLHRLVGADTAVRDGRIAELCPLQFRVGQIRVGQLRVTELRAYQYFAYEAVLAGRFESTGSAPGISGTAHWQSQGVISV